MNGISGNGISGSNSELLLTNPFDDDKLHEECGVFGAVSYTHLTLPTKWIV